MGTLKQWERVMERRLEALLARIFRSEPVELVDALRRECDGHAVVCSENRVVVPNAYDVELADTVHERLARQRDRVGQALTDSLVRHAERNGYEWAGLLTVHLRRSSEVPNGRYRVASCAMRHIRAGSFALAAGDAAAPTAAGSTTAEPSAAEPSAAVKSAQPGGPSVQAPEAASRVLPA
ncbi:DUF3662 domain-containing protein [Streptomyces sp. GC420]|nr:DUF3662 domain-containing protein [Streptomyces sp. GC420]